MRLLEAYLASEDTENTIHVLEKKMTHHMRLVKEEAETLSYLCLTDEAFQYRVASLCLAVETLRTRVLEAEAGIERFIQNTYSKWRTYAELQQRLLRLLTAKTIEGATGVKKMDRSSNFNVVKITGHSIDIEYKNSALVLPSTTSTVNSSSNSTPPALEIFQSTASLEQVIVKATELVECFGVAQTKIRVYQAHYDRLGNLVALRTMHEELSLTMEEVVSYVEETTGFRDKGVIREYVGVVNQCFIQMRELIRLESENCREYIFNTVNRFIECSTTYQRLLAHLRLYNVVLPCLQQQQQQQHQDVAECFSSMYQKSFDTLI